jgi:hypothetical protein
LGADAIRVVANGGGDREEVDAPVVSVSLVPRVSRTARFDL